MSVTMLSWLTVITNNLQGTILTRVLSIATGLLMGVRLVWMWINFFVVSFIVFASVFSASHQTSPDCLSQMSLLVTQCLRWMALQVSTADFSTHFSKTFSAFWARCLLSCNAQFPLGDSVNSQKAIPPPPDVSAGLPKPPLDVSADRSRVSDVFYQLLSLSTIRP